MEPKRLCCAAALAAAILFASPQAPAQDLASLPAAAAPHARDHVLVKFRPQAALGLPETAPEEALSRLVTRLNLR